MLFSKALPACIRGNTRAVNNEQTVSSSAALVTGLLHSACVSLKIADIIIPACEIPTQNTK